MVGAVEQVDVSECTWFRSDRWGPQVPDQEPFAQASFTILLCQVHLHSIFLENPLHADSPSTRETTKKKRKKKKLKYFPPV